MLIVPLKINLFLWTNVFVEDLMHEFHVRLKVGQKLLPYIYYAILIFLMEKEFMKEQGR